ncbi:MAG: cysteine--tRNA ligase [Eubacteriales bacterium]|nr:cysteine--tRNA ligase [Eubacteriales bacterium]
MKIYNTLTRKKEMFIPAEPGKVKIYACGPTVYNFFHIGNARPFIIFDTLRRYLEYSGYKVTFVQNFTDVDDKMIARAAEEHTSLKALGERFIKEYFIDAEGLGIRAADVHPKATEHIGDIIKLVKTLEEKGNAYEVGGDVYFDVSRFSGYGKLSGQSPEDLQAGARIDVTDAKRNPEDFALWKTAKPGEDSWDSPWGKGRPGWHIECSAMSMKYLGSTIDIHAGGQDLIFPHHENEIAQSEAATGKPFAHYWMHNGYINVDNEKMSKSKGNFFTVRDIAAKYDLMIVRLFMLSAHYRNPINFSEELIMQAASAMSRIKNCRDNLMHIIAAGGDRAVDVSKETCALEERFREAMDDDLNTAEAVGVIFEYIRDINIAFEDGGDKKSAGEALDALDRILDVLGLVPREDSIPEEINEMARRRAEARANRDFAAADQLRDEIAALGYELKDTPDGVKINRR